MVVGGSLSKTAVNVSAGGRTQLSGLLAAALAVVALLFLTGLFEDLPTRRSPPSSSRRSSNSSTSRPGRAPQHLHQAPRASVRLGRAARLHRRGRRAPRRARLGTLPGLFFGIGMSLLLLVYRASRPYVAVLGRTPGPEGIFRDVERHPDARPLDESWCCGSRAASTSPTPTTSARRSSRPATREGVRAVILDAETTPFVDVSAARMLADTRDELERQESGCCSPATSVRYATCCGAPPATAT